MKNVLIISGSPRKKGNSQILCEQFKKGAEAKGHQVELVRIMEKNIGFCRACDGCMRNGGTCVLKDDMAEILELFQKAEVLVLATPVYFYGISAQMKTFIDRTYPIWQHLGKKKFIILYRLVWIKILLKDHSGIWTVLWSIWRNTESLEGYMQQTSWMPDWLGSKAFSGKLMIWDIRYKSYMSGESYNGG